MNIGEDCLAKLDKVIVVLKRARRKSFLCIGLLDLIFDPLANRDLKKAGKLAEGVRIALESFKTSLEEDHTPPSVADLENYIETTNYFFSLVWDQPYAMNKNHIYHAIKNNLDASKNTKTAVQHILGRA